MYSILQENIQIIFKINLLCGCCESEVNWILYGAKSFENFLCNKLKVLFYVNFKICNLCMEY